MSESILYPAIEPFDSGLLRVSKVHQIYYEQVGNPRGIPVFFVHGGPGGGINSFHRQFFDPKHYRAILFEQRGCGRSTPYAHLEDNTTWHLVEDIEKLRKQLAIEKMLMFGGSWGSTLALAYASKHAEHLLGLILRGIFLCRPSEIEWFYEAGANQIFPDEWEIYMEPLKNTDWQKKGKVKAYHELLNSTDPAIVLKAAQAWSHWEGATCKLLPNKQVIAEHESDQFAIAFARIENHYFYHNAFFDSPNFLIEQIPNFRHVPTRIIQGRYDVVCPMQSAWDLHRSWPEADLRIIADAGHSATEPGISEALLAACEDFKLPIHR